MSLQTWQETLVTSQVDGPTLTAAAAATCIPPAALITIPAGWWQVGRMLKVTARGRISSVITTPGTARFQVRQTAVSVLDTGAITLNAAAVVTLPFEIEMSMTCRTIGNSTNATLFGFSKWTSTDLVSDHGHGSSMLVPNSAPLIGTGFDSTIANILDLFFTQTVSTGSLIVHQYLVQSLN